MRLFTAVLLLQAFAHPAVTPAAAQPQSNSQAQSQIASASNNSTITLPPGTKVVLEMTSPVWAKTAKPGDAVYAMTAFPVALNNEVAIPPGTYVEGEIDSLSRPGFFSPHAQMQIHFTKMIFANGYTVQFAGPQSAPAQKSAAATTPTAPPNDVLAAIANPYVGVTSSNDILLDNSTQIEMTLQLPLALNASSVAAAARDRNAAQPDAVKSATLCRPTPGTPGSPDTVIPGSPGTPPITIPGGPGMPDITIPGTPGTPPTVIPGMSGTPGTVCPAPPVVTSDPKPQQHRESFEISAPVQLAGKQLPAGTLEVSWAGSGPDAQVEILQNGNPVVTVSARVVVLDAKSPANLPATRTNSDGSLTLESLRFEGESLALYFDRDAS
jgi:hypothetical protein